MVGVLDTCDYFALAMATVALFEAGIIFEVVRIADLPVNLRTPEPKSWTPPSRILVSTEDAAEARSLIEQLEQPIPGEFDTASEPNPS